ncbi:hypothetical protein JHK85_029141 [Glycine max]|nr:hypothetical protein JHK85_029141 [Glycine max]
MEAETGAWSSVGGAQEDHELITYALTPASKLLINDSGHCLSPMVRLLTDPLLMSRFH